MMSYAIEFDASDEGALPIHLVATEELAAFREGQSEAVRRWLDASVPEPAPGDWRFVPGEGGPGAVVAFVADGESETRALAALAQALPAGRYRLAGSWDDAALCDAAWYWSGGAYRFGRYREQARAAPVLVLPAGARGAQADIEARALVRDLVNTPAGDLGPGELAEAADKLASEHGAKLRVVRGDELRREYPMIAAVGRAATREPVLVDLRWGAADAPKLTVVGKGVIFDSGGLDLKPADAMRNMKKDMGGAAHALGLAHDVMARGLPVRLRVLVPAVENAVAGDAYRPGDVLRSRKGTTVEIHNTDAEGRLVLADALTDAVAETPDLLFDFATLTGAARVALGPDVPAMFSNDDALAEGLLASCERADEPLWRMPLHRPYRSMLDSTIADMTNAGGRHAGAITAALFLQEFAGDAPKWAHLDLYAWNDSAKPGIPAGGEAQCLRGITAYIAATLAA